MVQPNSPGAAEGYQKGTIRYNDKVTIFWWDIAQAMALYLTIISWTRVGYEMLEQQQQQQQQQQPFYFAKLNRR